jgi:hypothetical protein
LKGTGDKKQKYNMKSTFLHFQIKLLQLKRNIIHVYFVIFICQYFADAAEKELRETKKTIVTMNHNDLTFKLQLDPEGFSTHEENDIKLDIGTWMEENGNDIPIQK